MIMWSVDECKQRLDPRYQSLVYTKLRSSQSNWYKNKLLPAVHKEESFQVNEKKVSGEIDLYPADVIRIGSPGEELQVIALGECVGS